MKLLVELSISVDGKITRERIKEVVIQSIPSLIGSEENGDGDDYLLDVAVTDVKEI